MRKRILSLALCFALTLSLLPTGALAADTSEWIEVEGIVGGKIKFDASTGTIVDCEETVTSANIPSSINGVPVTDIGNRAFEHCYSLSSVSIPNSVTSISNFAFYYCRSLSSASIGDGVTSIGDYAFRGCSSLSGVSIPGSVTRIGSWAFSYCRSLTSVSIPAGVTSIGNAAFSCCTRMESIFVDPRNSSYCSDGDGVLFNKSKTQLIQYPAGNARLSYSIPDGVTSIGDHAFYECSSLSSVSIPVGVTSIGWAAFFCCSNLSSVSIPGSVTSIDGQAFSDCSGLTDVYYAGTEEAWNKISIGISNTELTNATIHFNSTGPGDVKTFTRLTASTKKTSITVYENTHKSSSRTDDYQKSKGATISAEGIDYKTNEHGIATIPTITSGSIMVSKDDFVSRTISAEQLEVSQAVYLQPASQNGPVVSAVWIGNTDVLNTAYAIGLLSDQSTTLTAEVDWGSSSYGGIALMQDARTVNFTDDSLTTVLKNQFDVSDTIYIVATDAAGRTTKKALKFESGTVSAIPDWLDGIEFDLGKSMSVKLPDNVNPSWMAGQKIETGLSSLVPVTVSVDNGKVYVAIGVDLSVKCTDTWRESRETGNKAHALRTKTFIDKFKDTGILSNESNQSSLKKFQNLQSTYRQAIRYPQGKFGFDADFTILGFMEGYYDANASSISDVTWIDGGIILNPRVGVSVTYPLIPLVNLEGGISADIMAQLNLYLSEQAKQFMPDGSFTGKLTMNLGLGLGLKSIIYAEGGAEGNLTALYRFNYDPNRDNYFKLSASGNWYAKVNFLIWTYHPESEPWYDEVWYENPPANAAASASLMSSPEIYDTSSYEVKDLSYLNKSSQFTANQTGLRSMLRAAVNPSYLTRNTLKTNIYRESTPQYVQMSDGTGLAVWLDSTSSDINSVQLYYSYYNGETWSNPSVVFNDGTLDYTPYLTVINDNPYLVWQNATKTFTLSDSPETVAPYFDISIASFDADTGFDTHTISCDGLDMMPTLCGNSSAVYIVWNKNSENDWFSESGADSIVYCTLANGTLSEVVTAYDSLNSVAGLAADYNGELRIAYAIVDDTDNGSCLYEDGVRVTSEDSTESKPVYLNHVLYWNSNGTIIHSADEVQEEVTAVGAYQIVEVAGEKALVYTASHGLTSTLCVSYRNSETKQWSEPVELTDGSTFIGAFSASVSNGDTLCVLYNAQSVVGDYEDEDPYGESELSLVSLAPYCDLTMGELLYSADEYDAGSDMKFTFDLTNSGSQVIRSVGVEITDENNERLSYIVLDDEIVPGQTITASAFFKVDESATGQTVKVTAEPVGYSDVNSGDNSQTAALAFEDLSVENAAWGKKSDGDISISANIVNRGYSTRSNIVIELHKDQVDGEVVDTAKIPSLEPLSLNTVSFTLSGGTGTVYYIAVKDSGDGFTANDASFVPVTWTELGFAVIDSISDTSVQLYLSNEKAGTCMAAIYDENGKMLTLGTKEVTAEAEDITISYNQVKLPEHYTVKVFLADETSAPLCEAVLQEY